MGSGKHSNSDDTSSEDLELDQIDDQEKVSDDDDDDATTGGIGRSYECTFCKRGFTNAQALGGHMNIHRKDKAKSKSKSNSKHQKNNHHRESSSSTWLSNKSHTSVSSQYSAAATSVGGGAYMNYNYHQAVYFPASNYNLSRYNNNNHYDFMMTTSPGTAATVPDDQRLNLRIGNTATTRNKEEDEERVIDIDLELRLGH